jgi:hypothetical protein
MKLPIGKMSGQELEDFFKKSIEFNKDTFYKVIAEYEPISLYNNWRLLVRCIDEIINIPGEISEDTEVESFLNLSFDFSKTKNHEQLYNILILLTKQFGLDVSNRFKELSCMSFAINQTYQDKEIILEYGLNLSDVKSSIAFFQSRRLYYVSILPLIPQIACGTKKIDFIDILNYLQYHIDTSLVNITTSYYYLLLNESLLDFNLQSDGERAIPNFEYTHLEGFFMEPERLSLIDQMELRPEIVVAKNMIPKAINKVFSFSEVANAMSLYDGAFDKYKLNEKKGV